MEGPTGRVDIGLSAVPARWHQRWSSHVLTSNRPRYIMPPRPREGADATAIIFGWGRGRPEDKGAVAPATCPNCKNEVLFRYIVARKWFTLFFIPVIPYSNKAVRA